jgi:peptidoglycan/xylan/chitin deacetylase (PgdA/CDA1 family)
VTATGVSAAAAPAHPLAGLLTVMWHYVRSSSEAVRVGAGCVTPEAFEAQLDAIGRMRQVVGWPDVAEALDGGRPLPASAALLTFDDGLADHARSVAPRLLARGWTGVFFTLARQPGEPLTVGHAIHVLLAELGADGLEVAVRDRLSPADAARLQRARAREQADGVDPIDVLKRPLQRDLVDVAEPILHRLVDERIGPPGEVADALHLGPAAIEEMRAEGLTIGGHGRRHLWFDHASPDAVADEIRASATFLAAGRSPWPFAYPYGPASDAAPDELARHGFAAAFHATPGQPSGAYHLGRVDAEAPGFEAALLGAGE